MIEAETTPLPADRAKQLRDWLKRPEYETLKLVVEGLVQVHQVKALDKMTTALTEKSRTLADGSFEDARRFQNCLDVLGQIISPTTDLYTVKLE